MQKTRAHDNHDPRDVSLDCDTQVEPRDLDSGAVCSVTEAAGEDPQNNLQHHHTLCGANVCGMQLGATGNTPNMFRLFTLVTVQRVALWEPDASAHAHSDSAITRTAQQASRSPEAQ